MKVLVKSPYNENPKFLKPRWRQISEMIRLFFVLDLLPFEYFAFRFHLKETTDNRILEYIPYSWFLHNVNLNLTPISWSKLFGNKLLFNIYAKCHGVNVPQNYGIFNKTYGYDLLDKSSLRSADEIDTLFHKHSLEKVVIKDLSGTQGKNIYFVNDVRKTENGTQLLLDQKWIKSVDLVNLLGNNEYVIEEQLENSDFFKQISPNTLNTIRVLTFLNSREQVIVLAGFLRVGQGKLQVDNWHAGGLLVPINVKDGSMIDYGYDYSCKTYSKHPITGFSFKGVHIPEWEQLISEVTKYARIFPMIRFIAWDFAFTTKGLKVIEANVREINLTVCQLSDNGLAGLLREDLMDYGYYYPSDRIPSLTLARFLKKTKSAIMNFINGN